MFIVIAAISMLLGASLFLFIAYAISDVLRRGRPISFAEKVCLSFMIMASLSMFFIPLLTSSMAFLVVSMIASATVAKIASQLLNMFKRRAGASH